MLVRLLTVPVYYQSSREVVAPRHCGFHVLFSQSEVGNLDPPCGSVGGLRNIMIPHAMLTLPGNEQTQEESIEGENLL